MSNKKGQSGGLIGAFAAVIGIAMVLLILGVFQAYSTDIVDDLRVDFFAADTQTATCNTTSGAATGCGLAYNITVQNLEASANLSSKQSTLTNIAVAVIIISMLLIAASIVGIRIATG